MFLNKIISIFTFCIWLVYFYCVIKDAIKNNKINKKTTLKTLFKQNYKKVFKIFPTFLILIFIIFSFFQNTLVNKMLFFTICFYLSIDFAINNKIESISNTIKTDKFTYVIILCLISLPFLFYFLTSKLKYTYIWLFIYAYFAYFIVATIKLLIFKINNKK